MDKKRILFIYPWMIIGGSTTSLLALLNNIDREKYSVDLQLYRNTGPAFSDIPDYVNILPAAETISGRSGKIKKVFKFIFKGYVFKALIKNLSIGKMGFSAGIMSDFQAKELSVKNTCKYDYAVGFLEGWSNRYLAFRVDAGKKYAWIHSVFAKTTDNPALEIPWIKGVDNIVFVTDACKQAFADENPKFASRAITVANITDSRLIRKKSVDICEDDTCYKQFASFDGIKIVTVCRMQISTKGLDRIINCAEFLKNSNSRFLWCIVGDGEDYETVKQQIQDRNLDDAILLSGKRMNPYPFIAAADFMCMPSRYEGKPMVITESMILSTPPLVTQYLSANEQIENGIEGIIVENTDNSINEAVLKFMSDTQAIQRMKKTLSEREYGNSDYVREIEKKIFS